MPTLVERREVKRPPLQIRLNRMALIIPALEFCGGRERQIHQPLQLRGKVVGCFRGTSDVLKLFFVTLCEHEVIHRPGSMISFSFLFLHKVKNGVDALMDPRDLLEGVCAREDNEQHQQNRNRNQQRESLAKDDDENGHANSDDKQKPETKKILGVKVFGVS